MKRVNRKKIVSWEVENHTGGKAGVSKGEGTGIYTNEQEAIQAMCEAKARGEGSTCIVRNIDGEGQCLTLGLVR